MSVPGGTQQWMFQERTMGVISINTDDLYRYASDGCWGWFNYDGGASSPVMWAKYPASAGDMYMTGEYAGDTTTVVSTGTSVTVSAGTYTCHRYQIVIYRDDWRRVENYYLAPDVGYVKYEEYYRPAGGTEFLQSVWELDSLDLN